VASNQELFRNTLATVLLPMLKVVASSLYVAPRLKCVRMSRTFNPAVTFIPHSLCLDVQSFFERFDPVSNRQFVVDKTVILLDVLPYSPDIRARILHNVVQNHLVQSVRAAKCLKSFFQCLLLCS
jgi:hypothetical protein